MSVFVVLKPSAMVPKVPNCAHLNPLALKIEYNIDAVVVLPFVPVIPIIFKSFDGSL